MKHIIATAYILLLISSTSLAQKVKYKDLFILLKAENYKDADPYLRTFLKNNPEAPHANYSMGKMLQYYMNQGDVLNGRQRLGELADSALMYYKNAANLITEKEVKKHKDDYYLDFRRRDLRTGKFAVKISDVQYDIENRTEAVSLFKKSLTDMVTHLDKAKTFYKAVQESYNSFAERMKTVNMLYFTATNTDINAMRDLVRAYDSCLYHLNTYRSIMKNFGKAAITQELVQKPIDQYPDDGLASTDYYAKTIVLVNYKDWANESIDILLKRIFPLKKRIISFDARVKELHDNVVNDSLDKRDEVFRLATENVGRDLRDYQQGTLPAAIFDYRIAEINYHSALNYWYRAGSDAMTLDVKKDALNDFSKQISGLNKLLNRIRTAYSAEQLMMFNEYITASYGGEEGIQAFIDDQEKSVKEDSTHISQWLKEIERIDRLAIWQSDSISLDIGRVRENEVGVKYQTVLLDTLSDRVIGFYTIRLEGNNNALAFGVAPSSRVVDSLYVVSLSDSAIDKSITLPTYLVDTVGVGQRLWAFYSHELQADSSYVVQVILSDLSTGVPWTNKFNIKDLPAKLMFSSDRKEYFLKDENDNDLLVLDLFGKQVVDEEPEGAEEGNPDN